MAIVGGIGFSSAGGGGGSSTITSFLGSTTNGPVNVTQIGGSAISLGQALAAASLPVVLTASQLTTLTPPSNTGYALDSSLTTIDTDLKSNITLHAGSNTIGQVNILDSSGNNIDSIAINASRSVLVALPNSGGSGSISSLNGTYTTSTSIPGTVVFAISGTWSATLTFQGDINGTWVAINVTDISTGNIVTTTTSNGNFIASGPYDQFRIIATAYSSGTASIKYINSASDSHNISLDQPIPVGTNNIGIVDIADTGGNKITTNSTTFTSKFALDTNLLGTLGTAFSTAGKVDVKGADGDVFVRQATASNLNATVVGTGTFAVQATLAAETTKVIGTVNQGTSPWIVAGGGTAGTAASGVVTVQGIAGMTKLLVTPDANSAVNIAQYGGNNVISAGTNGALAIGGTVATNVAITANPINLGAQAVSSENAAVTTARQVQLVADLVGKLIVLPYANPENFVSGRATATDTTSTSLLGAPAAGLRNYITQITVWNSSATSTYIKIQDGSGGTELYDIPAPAGGGATLTLPTPLRQPTTATAIFFAANASANAVFVSASGYKGA